ncbi:DNA-directed RNA polymerase II complex subunit Rpb9 [Schizosaccharomyces cryophilus OY26]|uniref:DNA-directed RNA polymerase subunit n=1 Tax=Schizosaccharomyces cryophilus (strain OY26 / ATCC MYA-4695 / CBS 11777 / NBRC 106824 / NRRL Y48691) TaxID=653667 RepID=S9VVW8_SCHCR|nr:DNA-directed RNA polymerase II complex subunit Rpb9 [Schizosaccharomyces cryophilus OY26]EPY50329.1 DNA-directed RNA polymerase II complex subunit Rpb9 [Schizosaccharomyces cryophilus OY26]
MSNFQYCIECNNMLYPREDKIARTLRLACRNCDYSEVAATSKVYRHELITSNVEGLHFSQDAATDYTLPRTEKECPRCHHHEAVFYQMHSRRGDSRMTLVYVCAGCGFAYEDQ